MITRRQALQSIGGGLGLIGLAPCLQAGTHFPARAKRVIHLFMNGGPFQADTFDPKPMLNRYAGQRPAGVDLRTERPTGNLLGSPFRFDRHGQSGLEISELLPNLAKHADRLCVLRSMYTDHPNHGPALFLMNNGALTPNRPSLGAWMSYGLGTENQNLPAHVVLCPGRPVRFAELWTSAFLPGEHQGSYVNHSNLDPKQMIPYLSNASLNQDDQRRQLSFLQNLNEQHRQSRGVDAALDSRIQALETAFQMQMAATDAFDLAREPQTVRRQYGTGHFANGCLLARRLSERGVRFVQLYYGNGQPWDTHGNHTNTTRNLCRDIDQPIAALLSDLEHKGLLDETLVVWGGEFGRTSTSENNDGRDHNPWGFSMWLAGGGSRGGVAHGATDEFGFRSVEKKVHIHDLHATILHLLGIDHERLTYRHAGRDYRLTDVHGHVVRDVIA